MASQEVTTSPRDQKILELAAKGWTAEQIACKLAPNAPKKKRHIRRRIQRTLAKSPEFQGGQKQLAQGMILEAMPSMVRAQIKRAQRGRTDALKLLMEVSGVHNPKVQHEHSGGIELKITAVPRPVPVDNTPQRRQLDEPIVDAEVVDED